MKKRIAFILIFTPLSIALTLPEIKAQIPDEYSAKNIHKYVNTLIQDGDYYRAYVELKRLEFFHPQYRSSERFGVTGNYLLFKGKKYHAIVRAMDENRVSAPASIFVLDAYISLNKNKESWEFGASLPGFDAEPLKGIIARRRFLSSLLDKKFDDAAGLVREYREALTPMGKDLLRDSMKEMRDMKSPGFAAALGFFPGMGYFYAGNRLTGVVALIVISLNALVTYFAFNTGNTTIGILSGTVGGLFYSGSIFGGYLAARRYNSAVEIRLSSYIGDSLDVDKDREYIQKNYGIGSEVAK